jgi:DNA-binding CsgD family transcriptional regulator
MIVVSSNIDFGAWSWDIPNHRVTFTRTWFSSLGYPVPKNLDQDVSTWEKLIHPDDKNRVTNLLNRHLDGKSYFYHCVNRLMTNSGVYRENLDVGVVIVRNNLGKPLIMTGVDIDLSKTRFSQKELEDNTDQYTVNQLTPKEVQVCELFKRGFNDVELASALSISPNTVKTHLTNICKKFKTSPRIKLLANLYKNDLVQIVLPAIEQE